MTQGMFIVPGENYSALLMPTIEGAYISSYLAFCANVNANALDSAFGKNNEASVRYLGKQLSLYSAFMGESIDLSYLEQKHTLTEIFSDNLAVADVVKSFAIQNLIDVSPYATSKYTQYVTTQDELDALALAIGDTGSHTSINTLITTDANTISLLAFGAGPVKTIIKDATRKNSLLIHKNFVYNIIDYVPAAKHITNVITTDFRTGAVYNGILTALAQLVTDGRMTKLGSQVYYYGTNNTANGWITTPAYSFRNATAGAGNQSVRHALTSEILFTHFIASSNTAGMPYYTGVMLIQVIGH